MAEEVDGGVPFPLLASSSLLSPSPLFLSYPSSAAAATAAVLLFPLPNRRPRKRRREPSPPEEPEPPPPPPSPAMPPPYPSPDHFPILFRVSASTFSYLTGLLDPLLSSPSSPPPSTLLALALFRLASGLPYSAVAARFSVAPDAARAATRRLRRVLLANFRFWLAFPSPASLPSLSAAFGARLLPSCCGALGCARFGPLAAQLLVDPSSRILSLAAGFRSDRTDFQVLKLSSLYADLQSGRLLGPLQYLVADGSGYPLLPWLMVPFPCAEPGSPEGQFNAAHQSMCRPVRQAAASLRGWRVLTCLDKEDDGPKAAAASIGTCAMLHNLLLTREDYSALSSEEDVPLGSHDEAELSSVEVESRAVAMRNALVASAAAAELEAAGVENR